MINLIILGGVLALLVLTNVMFFINWRRAERRAAEWEAEARRILEDRPKP